MRIQRWMSWISLKETQGSFYFSEQLFPGGILFDFMILNQGGFGPPQDRIHLGIAFLGRMAREIFRRLP